MQTVRFIDFYSFGMLHVVTFSNFVHFPFNCTDTDKHRGNREVFTQTPAPEPASEQDNGLGYKGTAQVPEAICVHKKQ